MSRFATYYQLSRSSQILNLFFRKVPSLHPDVLFACASPFSGSSIYALKPFSSIFYSPDALLWSKAGGLRRNKTDRY
jgi:hypothetical protein